MFRGIIILLYYSLVAVYLTVVQARQCYLYGAFFEPDNTTQSPALPKKDATVQNCTSADDFCTKTYMYTVVRQPDDTTKFGIRYMWGCTDQSMDPFPENTQCNDTQEWGSGTDNNGTWTHHYWRTCSCCGDLCNGEAMDESCGEEPQFEKTCYAAGTWEPIPYTSPVLREKAVEIPCTATQSCTKTSAFLNGTSLYVWGCNNPPMGVCGGSLVEMGKQRGDLRKMCSCCGSRCNGKQMNAIVANNSECIGEEPTTPLPPTTTTASPPNSNDNTVVIVGAVLGTFLFVILVALTLAIFYIFRLRRTLESTQSDRQQIVMEAPDPTDHAQQQS